METMPLGEWDLDFRAGLQLTGVVEQKMINAIKLEYKRNEI